MNTQQIKKFAASGAMAVSLLAVSTFACADTFKFDPEHSFVQFRISHLGFSTMVGRFNELAGQFSYDKAAPEKATVSAVVKTDSIDTHHAERDKHLRSKDFLEVEKFPEATFKSTKFTPADSGGKLEGNLTLHGVTKPIVIEVSQIGEGKDPWGGYRSGFTGKTTIKRSDFGMTHPLGEEAETVQLEFFVEGIKQ